MSDHRALNIYRLNSKSQVQVGCYFYLLFEDLLAMVNTLENNFFDCIIHCNWENGYGINKIKLPIIPLSMLHRRSLSLLYVYMHIKSHSSSLKLGLYSSCSSVHGICRKKTGLGCHSPQGIFSTQDEPMFLHWQEDSDHWASRGARVRS